MNSTAPVCSDKRKQRSFWPKWWKFKSAETKVFTIASKFLIVVVFFCKYLNSRESICFLMCSNISPSLASNNQLFLIQEQAVQTIMSYKKMWFLDDPKFQIQNYPRGQESHPGGKRSRESEGHVFLWCLLVGEIKEEDARQGADQEDDVKPTVVEVELQLSQNFGHNGAILQRHAHTHQQHGWYKIHPLRHREWHFWFIGLFVDCAMCYKTIIKQHTHHDLSEYKHDDIGWLAAWYCIEELKIKKHWILS